MLSQTEICVAWFANECIVLIESAMNILMRNTRTDALRMATSSKYEYVRTKISHGSLQTREVASKIEIKLFKRNPLTVYSESSK